MNRETLLVRTFVELADSLVDRFDLADFLRLLTERAVDLLGVAAAGLILADHRGQLSVMATTSHEARLLEIFQLLDAEGGPCLECHRTGQPQVNVGLDAMRARWPRFHTATVEAGFRSSHAIPLRLRHEVVGSLDLFCSDRSELSEPDVDLARALADTATLGLLQERVTRKQSRASEQLQHALDSRVLIEQAKGVLAERASLGVDEAFALLRDHSRAARMPLVEVARAVVSGDVTLETLQGAARPQS